MDSSKVLMLGALGVGGYLAWQWYNNQATVTLAAAGATSAPAAPGTLAASATPATPAAPTAPAAPAAPSASATSLDSLYSALEARATAGGINTATGNTGDGSAVGPDGWNYYLSLVYGASLPAPEATFPGVDRSAPMTLAAYWGPMSQWLKTTHGLAGLGIYGGLGVLAARYR